MRERIPFLVFTTGLLFFSTGFLCPVLAYTIEKVPNLAVVGDFMVSPAENELFLDPGQTAVRQLTITSRLGKEMKFLITTEDFTGSKTGETASVLLGEEKGPYSLKDYLKPEITEFTLQQGEKMVLPIEISIPGDAEPGGRYGAVLVSAVPASPEAEASAGEVVSGVKVKARIAALYLVRVKGEVQEKGTLKEIKMAGPAKAFYEKGPFSFELAFENKGNVHLVPYGIIEIKNLLDRKVGEIEITPWFAMPDSLRLRTVKWDRGFAFGRYTATAKINRGYQDIIDEKSISFWVLPWKVIAVGLGILVVVITLLTWLFSRFEIRRKNKF